MNITDYTGVDPAVRPSDANPSIPFGANGRSATNVLVTGVDRRSTYFPVRSYTVGVDVVF